MSIVHLENSIYGQYIAVKSTNLYKKDTDGLDEIQYASGKKTTLSL
jgi:hypothetical protein